MTRAPVDAVDDLPAALRRDGYAFVAHTRMRELLGTVGTLADWPAFAASWNDLALDTYLADFGRYRRRRHAVFHAERDGTITREAHQPHWQSLEYNALQGGIERWFEAVESPIASGTSLQTILRLSLSLFGGLASEVDSWRVEVHQFRIEARAGEPGQPTPEGVHRDGVDFVLVLLVDRVNIASGTTTIHAAAARELLGSFTLTRPLDAALVDDARVFHGVTPVEAINPALPAHRDVLVVTFKRT
ncbi:MAG: 2OG-Fe dioxygenase family protein [Proteobacteria bacterium]|nr:2OG-Fe dioxygenase family protein [Pseudomonadota bacterium]